MPIPLDTNTSVKTTEKLNKHKGLEIEVERMWGSNNNGTGGYESPWHHQEGHGKLHQRNSGQHEHA